jgi:hypothetical protein
VIGGNGPWGRGPRSGLPWWSGVAWNGADKLAAFVAGPRAGRPVDMLQLFAPKENGLAASWDMLAGGAGDDPETCDGVLTFTRGGKQGQVIWGDPATRALPVVYSIRLVPADPLVANAAAARPETWLELARGAHEDVWRRLGMRLAHLDAKWGRTAPLVLEPGWEMSGDWYDWSLHGKLADGHAAWQVFPSAWGRVVGRIREGYLKEARRQPPLQFLFRPGRAVLPGGVRMDRYLPSPGDFDLIGLSQHDNQPQCSLANPRACWEPARGRDGVVAMEGLLLLAELADRHKRGILIAEWAGYPPGTESGYPSNAEGEAFVQAIHDFFSTFTHLAVGECFFDRSVTSFSTRLGWSASQAYRKLWGAGASSTSAS